MTDIVSSLLIPYSQVDNILLPQSAVECILPYATPLSSSYKHHALIGSLIYNNSKVPLLDLRHIENPPDKVSLPQNTHGKYRIVVLSSAYDGAFCQYYAIIATSQPFLAKIEEDSLVEMNTIPSPFFYSKARLWSNNSEFLTYIPNLDAIEKELFSNK